MLKSKIASRQNKLASNLNKVNNKPQEKVQVVKQPCCHAQDLKK